MTEVVAQVGERVSLKLGPFPPTGTGSKSYLLEYLHFKGMAPRSFGKEFWVLEYLHFKGQRKDL